MRIPLALAVFTLSACTAAPPAAGEVQALAVSFDPSAVTIRQGETVTWYMAGENHHTVTIADPDGPVGGTLADSQDLGPGARYSFTFQDAGVHNVYCRYHSQGAQGVYDPSEMTMTVTVEGAADA